MRRVRRDIPSSHASHPSRIPGLVTRHERDQRLTLDDAGGAPRRGKRRRLLAAKAQRALAQGLRRAPGRDLGAASERTAMARQPQPRQSPLRQGAVISPASRNWTYAGTHMRPLSRIQGAEQEARNSFETHASPGDRWGHRPPCWPPTAAHPWTTWPLPGCVPVSEAGTRTASAQSQEAMSWMSRVGHGHG